MKHLTSKILLLGDQATATLSLKFIHSKNMTRVGKSTLALRLTSANINLLNISPTLGVSYLETKVEVGDHVIHLQLWDTAGQERFKAMIPMYYRNSSGALLVYDITDRNSFLAMKQWEEELRIHGEENITMFVVGNKYDSAQTERSVSQAEASTFAQAIGAYFFEVSALSNLGIEELKLDLCLKLIHNSQRSKMSLSSYEDIVGDEKTIRLKKRRSISDSLAMPRRRCCS